MESFNADYISLTDIAQAYRKVKADTFCEKSLNVAVAFAEYESDLYRNLEKLHRKLTKPIPKWPKSDVFIGTYAFLPKKLLLQKAKQVDGTHFISSDPMVAWKDALRRGEPRAELRPIASFTVNMHVISSLWVNKVGHKFDGALGRSSYGNRVRRYRPDKDTEEEGNYQLDANGTFKPYFTAYRSWRRNGMNAARTALKAGNDVVVVTMDLQSFYHSIDPTFILNATFHKKAGVKSGRRKLSADDVIFSQQLVEAFQTWARQVPGFKAEAPSGLPVGPAAARVMANCLLCDFDRQVYSGLAPIYYGRYVDDIFLVLKATDRLTSPDAIIQHLVGHVKALKKTKNGMAVKAQYAEKSNLLFNTNKLHTFHLTPVAGEDLLDTIERRIQDVSSEWRLLPDPDELDRSPAAKVLAASRDPGDEADSFAKADHLSIRRLGLSITLRNCDALERDLPSPEWQDSRYRFYKFAEAYVLSPLRLFEQYPYFSRLIGLAVACGDLAHALRFVRRIRSSISQLERSVKTLHGPNECSLSLQNEDEKEGEPGNYHQAWNGVRKHIADALYEGVIRSFDPSAAPAPDLSPILKAINRIANIDYTEETTHRLGLRLSMSDLARTPLKDLLIGRRGTTSESGTPVDERFHDQESWRLNGVRDFISRGNYSTDHLVALLFPTRPHSPAEIGEVTPEVARDVALWRVLTRALRGVWVTDENTGANPTPFTILVPDFDNRRNWRIAVPSFMTESSSWSGAASGTADLSRARYRRLIKIVNAIIECDERPRYAVFPELSIPRRWIRPLAHTLLKEGISLIAGVEYERDGTVVRNEAHLYLRNTSLGYPSYLRLSQLKEFPSHGERDNLRSMFGVSFPPPPAAASQKAIFDHGGFCFSVLVCSELSNVEHAAAFRGNVDAVFVLSWNQDLESFEALLDAAALDVHCFQVLVNNRLYGDSRIRAPFRERWRRDVVRIKGGLEDYVVVAELDIDKLRDFQSHAEPPQQGLFKPTPEGFRISKRRRVVPRSDGP